MTGASGFLGLPIVDKLASCGRYNIYAATTGRRLVAFPEGVHTVKVDLLNRDQSSDIINEISPDMMVHLAWELSESDYMNSADNIIWLEESLQMLRTFISSGGKYFAFAGSSAEYERFKGFSEDRNMVLHFSTGKRALPVENNKNDSISMYGRCKSTFNGLASGLCAANKVDYVNLRFFPTLGKGMRSNLSAPAKAVSAFLAGERFECRSPYNIWDFIHVDDASGVACAILQQQHTGIVNIGSGIPRIMKDVFTAISRKMDCEHLLHFNLDNNDKEILVANTEVLDNIIGYKCTVGFDEMLSDIIECIRERG